MNIPEVTILQKLVKYIGHGIVLSFILFISSILLSSISLSCEILGVWSRYNGGIRGIVETVLGDLTECVQAIYAVDIDTSGEYLQVYSEFEADW